MTTPARARYGGYRFPAEIIGHAVWLYFRFPLGLRMVEELLAVRGIIVSYETVRQWARKFGQQFVNQIRRRLPRVGDKMASRRCVTNTSSENEGVELYER
jgi:putative transposase